MVVIIVALGIASEGKAFNALGLKNNIKIIAQFGIIAIGAALLMIAGEFDLSIGSMIGFAGCSMALMLKWGLPFGLGEATPATAFFMTLAMTLALGWFIGFIVVRSGLASFIVTLAFLFLLRGMTEVSFRLVNDSTQVSGLPDYKQDSAFANAMGGEVFGWFFDAWFWLGRTATEGRTMFEGLFVKGSTMIESMGQTVSQLGDSISLWSVKWVNGEAGWAAENLGGAGRLQIDAIERLGFLNINRKFEQWVTGFDARFMWFILLALVAYVVLSRTRLGNWIYATGDNKESARANGVPVNSVKIGLFMFTAFCATLFAACQVFDTNTADAAKGNLMELYAIAIAVVGGTLMTGGFGSVLGVVLGAITVGLVFNAVFFIPAIDGSWFRVFLGAILLAAVFANERIRKRITGGI